MIIGIYNNKGGVGKSTLVSHIAFRAMDKNIDCTVIDTDTQSNSLMWLSNHKWEAKDDSFTVGSVTVTPNFEYNTDFVLIDCPPAFDVAKNYTMVNIWIIPVNGRFSVTGAMTVIDEIRSTNKNARIVLVSNQSDLKSKYGKKEREEAEKLGVEIFNLQIPYSDMVRRAEMLGVPVWKVPYSTRSVATTTLEIFCDWVLGGMNNRGLLK
jgi:chromosome partitioning protein